MKQAIYWLARSIGVFTLCRWLTRKDLRILAYHGIWLGEGHFGNFLYMSATRFAARMQTLKDLGYPVLSLEDGLRLRAHGTLPAGATVITIDDGWRGTYLHMLPELVKHRFPSTLYVTTYYVEHQAPVFDVALQYMLTMAPVRSLNMARLGIGPGINENTELSSPSKIQELTLLLRAHADTLEYDQQRQELLRKVGDCLGTDYAQLDQRKLFHLSTFDQIQEMASQGIDIQLHTHRHRIYKKGESCLEKELEDNRAALQAFSSEPLTHFCYPSGEFDISVWPILESLGIASATTTDTGLAGSKAHRYALPRILDGESVSDLEFEAEMSGFGEIIRKLKYLFTR